MKTTTQPLRVSIALEPWQRIQHWIQLADGFEGPGLGLVDEERDEDGQLTGYVVTDVFLPEQVNGRTSTELKPESVAKLIIEVEEQAGASEKLRFWWHHHPGGIGLMWSHTDDDCVEELANGAWFVSTVFDDAMRCRTRVDLYAPLRLTLDQVDTDVRYPDLVDTAPLEALYRKRVTRRAAVAKAAKGRRLFPLPGIRRANESNPVPSPLPGRHVTAEELLLAQEQVETGEMSFGEYVALAEGADCLLGEPEDPGWFDLDIDEDDNGEEVAR